MAQYWPSMYASNSRQMHVLAGASTNHNPAMYYLVTQAIPTNHQHLEVQMVKFTLRSCDQGWGGIPEDRGTYNGSWSWFEAGIVRGVPAEYNLESDLKQYNMQNADTFNSDAFGRSFAQEVVNPLTENQRWELQYNLTASSDVRDHEIIWDRHDIIDEEAE
ncbi:hypothetical protein H0H92_004053, partial [Tricholoma furcatifolium]